MIRARVMEDLVLPKYIVYYLDSELSRTYFRRKARSTAGSMPKINQTHIKNAPIPLAPLNEQKRIISKIQELFALANNIEAMVRNAQGVMKIIDKAILVKAFSGELVPQDSNDEPASVPLQQINVTR